MHLTINYIKSKTTIIFIHGFLKNSSYWNLTETGHPIEIEAILAKTYNTVLIDLIQQDYIKSISEIANEIYIKLEQLIKTKIILVGHSHGAFYCLRLAELYPVVFSQLILLDPTVKNDNYLNFLKSKDDIITQAKLKHFDDLPSGNNLKSSIIIRIHINIDSTLINDIKELDVLVNKNTKSRLIVHYNVTHMIHYKIPHTIIDSIRELIKISN